MENNITVVKEKVELPLGMKFTKPKVIWKTIQPDWRNE